jgi:hypothetical protein
MEIIKINIDKRFEDVVHTIKSLLLNVKFRLYKYCSMSSQDTKIRYKFV